MSDDKRASARRRAANEILAWARFVPEAFTKARQEYLHQCLTDCDAGIRCDLLRAVGFLNDGGAVAALEEYARLETEAPNCKAMAVALLGRFSRAKS